jgi:hypothetical protein
MVTGRLDNRVAHCRFQDTLGPRGVADAEGVARINYRFMNVLVPV